MLYLIKSAAFDGNGGYITLLKIGYASNMDIRLLSYQCHNPTVELLASRDGGEKEEERFHEYFKEFKYPKRKEWFYYNEKIIKEFPTISIESLPEKKYSYQTVLKRLREKIRKILPDDIKDLSSKFSFPFEGSEKQSLEKFYYKHKLWERGIVDELFGSNLEKRTVKQNSLLSDYLRKGGLCDKVKFVCELYFSNKTEDLNILLDLISEIDPVKECFKTLGPERCRALSYHPTRLLDNLKNKMMNSPLAEAVLKEFKLGERLLNSIAKERLSKVYSSIGYTAVAKARDLSQWFVIQKIRLSKDPITGKEVCGILLKLYR